MSGTCVDPAAELERVRAAVAEILAENGCDCECDHHHTEHATDCERCLACRIEAAVWEVRS